MKRNEWGRNAIAGFCAMFLSFSGLTLCFCSHEEACEEHEHPTTCEHTCLCAKTAHDHVTLEQPNVIVTGKAPRVESMDSGGESFDFCGCFCLGCVAHEGRSPSGALSRKCGDHAIALVRLSRRLC